METLFDENLDRGYEGPADYAEPHFSYINRSGRPEFTEAREILEQWYQEYASMHPADALELRTRFRLTSDNQHLGALTELYSYHMLISNGYQIQPHPEIISKTARPDFLASKAGTPAFYVECTTIYGGLIPTRVNKFEAGIQDAVNELSAPDFLVSITYESVNHDTPPAVGSLKRNLQTYLAQLNYESVCREIEQRDTYPEWTWRHNGWVVNFRISPVSEEGRNRRDGDSRIIGSMTHGMAKHVTLDDDIKKAVKVKANKYGKLEFPFLVITNVISDSIFCDDRTIMNALFGKEILTFRRPVDGVKFEPKWARDLDGVFVHPTRIINTRLSGILVVNGLFPWTVKIVKPKIWHHPKAAFPLGKEFLNIPMKVHNPANDRIEDFIPAGIQSL